jgi:hypothetical protein
LSSEKHAVRLAHDAGSLAMLCVDFCNDKQLDRAVFVNEFTPLLKLVIQRFPVEIQLRFKVCLW